MSYHFLSLALFCASCLASVLREPTGTIITSTRTLGTSRADAVASLPQVTEAPRVNFELLRRDVQTALIAPDNTCGFYGGYSNSNWLCFSTTDTCVLYLTASSAAGVVGCCNSIGCLVQTACVESAPYWTSSVCNSACASDPAVIKCTDKIAPYCGGGTFPGLGVRGFGCQPTPLNFGLLPTYYTTYGTVTRSYKTTTYTPLPPPKYTISPTPTSTSTGSSTSTSTGSSTSTSTSSQTTTSSSSLSTSPSTSLSPFPASSITLPAPTTSDSSASSATPIGAIVGGSVGGVAFIGLIAVLLALWFRKASKDRTQTQAQAQAQSQTGPQVFGTTQMANIPAAPVEKDAAVVNPISPSMQSHYGFYGKPSPTASGSIPSPYVPHRPIYEMSGAGYSPPPPNLQQPQQWYAPASPGFSPGTGVSPQGMEPSGGAANTGSGFGYSHGYYGPEGSNIYEVPGSNIQR